MSNDAQTEIIERLKKIDRNVLLIGVMVTTFGCLWAFSKLFPIVYPMFSG